MNERDDTLLHPDRHELGEGPARESGESDAPVRADAPARAPGKGPTARELIAQGLAAKEPTAQLELFRRAHERDLNDAFGMSYHGMAIACVQHHYQQGIVFCEEAVRRVGPNPDLLVNLARAYLAAKNKREAVRALRRAMARAPKDWDRARAELVALGLRRTPVIPFLPRSFVLNKWLGQLRHWVLTRRAPNDDGSRPIPAELGQLSGDVATAKAQLTAGEPGCASPATPE